MCVVVVAEQTWPGREGVISLPGAAGRGGARRGGAADAGSGSLWRVEWPGRGWRRAVLITVVGRTNM